jgi:GTP-binding protein HflX
VHDTQQKREKAFLVSVRRERMGEAEALVLFQELKGLADTLGLEVAGEFALKLRETHAKLLCGEGKAEELCAAAQASGADSIVFNHIISPTQQRNWEELTGLDVYDRQELIIKIFASRARTKEATLQTELARLEYSLPRLAHSYTELSRQRGGRYGTKGSGEQKLELDRREIRKRITRIKDELLRIRQDRGTMRKKRDRLEGASCAIVGYTNAGKSSLLNALTKADVLAESKLFATLDPTTKKLSVGTGTALLMTDTVGFIRELPHGLVEAFRATLEEALNADFLVHVLDATEHDLMERYQATRAVLEELGIGEKASIVVFNKCDLVADPGKRAELAGAFPGALFVSCLTREGLEAFASRLRGFAEEAQREAMKDRNAPGSFMDAAR